jgi:hypothetical protein
MNLPEKLPKMLPGSVCAQRVKCGRPNCRCAQGRLHGPYFYRFWREGGRLRKQYVPPADVDRVRSRCEARRESRRQEHRHVAATLEWCRAMEKRLRAMIEP